MISKLKGLLDSVDSDQCVIDCNGVCYLVFCASRTLARLPKVGEAVSLEIETHVREDHIHLYGFADKADRDWFRLLTTVQGVGSKVALAIQSVLGAGDLVQAIAAQDKAALSRANGVGPKVATRIVTELKDKVGNLVLGQGAALAATASPSDSPAAAPAFGGVVMEAVSALVNLGYGRSEALSAVSKANKELGGDAALGELIRIGLRDLSVLVDSKQ